MGIAFIRNRAVSRDLEARLFQALLHGAFFPKNPDFCPGTGYLEPRLSSFKLRNMSGKSGRYKTQVTGHRSQGTGHRAQGTGHYLTYTESILNIHKS